MKRFLYTIIIALTGFSFTQAQRMIPGQKGVEVNTGILSNDRLEQNYYINVGLSINENGGNYQLWTLEYTRRSFGYKNSNIPMETYIIEGGYSFQLLSNARKNVAFNITVSAHTGYESINRGVKILYDGSKILNDGGFIYGMGGRLSLETYLSDRLVFLILGRTRLVWGTSLERFLPSAGFGLRVNF